MDTIELNWLAREVSDIECRHIHAGIPVGVAQHACYAEWHQLQEVDDAGHWDVDAWEAGACAFWFTDRLSWRYAYTILRAFRKFDSVAVNEWPEGLAVGQIGTGKSLTIKGPERPAKRITIPARLLPFRSTLTK